MAPGTLSISADTSRSAIPAADKLRLLASPVTEDVADDEYYVKVESITSERPGLPRLKRYLEPNLLEIFFDLFFAAVFNVFNDSHKITNLATFKTSIGYFCLLWLTWFLVTLFDVRFLTDSILARITRAAQMGVMIGFVVVAPKFDTSSPEQTTMRALSLILLFSRISLVVDYLCTAWKLRLYKSALPPLYIQSVAHAVAAVIYLGVSFGFVSGHRRHVFMAWYFVSGSEAIFSILFSNFSPVMALTDTHLMKRLMLLTVMIIGEGIQETAREVVKIVKNPGAWDPTTIGQVTAAAATMYFVLLIYFDWERERSYLPKFSQQIWTALHLPFHLALVLFLQSFTQLLIWQKVAGQLAIGIDLADPTNDPIAQAKNVTSLSVATELNASIAIFFEEYPPVVPGTWATIDEAIRNISVLPDSIWNVFTEPGTNSVNITPDNLGLASDTLINAVEAITISLVNAVFSAFGIDRSKDVIEKNPNAATDTKSGGLQFTVNDKTWSLYGLVFAYGYIAAGCTLAFMVALSLIIRKVPVKPWPIARIVIVSLLALGMGLAAILWFDVDRRLTFLNSPWVLPTITIVWTIVLIIIHINGESVKQTAFWMKGFGRVMGRVFRARRRRRDSLVQ